MAVGEMGVMPICPDPATSGAPGRFPKTQCHRTARSRRFYDPFTELRMGGEYPVIVDAMPPGRRHQGHQARENFQGREDKRGLPGGERLLQAVHPGLLVPPVQALWPRDQRDARR